MKSTQRFSVLIWADKRKTDAKGNVPLYARITYLGKRAEISMGRKVDPDKWDPEAGFVKGPGQEVKDINKEIITVNNEIHAAFMDLKQTDDFITAEKIKQRYAGEEEPQRMLLEVFDKHNKNVEDLVGKDFVKATLTKYNTVRSKTADYIWHKFKKADIYLESIDYAFVAGFEIYLKTVDGIEHNTAMRYMKNLKKIVNLAFNHGWIRTNPFNLFKCTYKKVNRMELEWEEIQQLANHPFAIKRLEEVRDTFLFCCYTGYAFVDIEKLTPQHIHIGPDKVTWIKTMRTKTYVTANVPLIPQAIKLIEKYKDHDCRIVQNKLFPVKSNQKMNAYLKEIGDLAWIYPQIIRKTSKESSKATIACLSTVILTPCSFIQI